jgi:hypothetical protein
VLGVFGVCVEGTCICKKGWKGVNCDEMDKDALQCLPDCSGHGTFDLEAQTCQCEPMWSGEDCSKGKIYFLVLFLNKVHMKIRHERII